MSEILIPAEAVFYGPILLSFGAALGIAGAIAALAFWRWRP